MRDVVIGWIARLVDRETWWRQCRRPAWSVVATKRNVRYTGGYAVWDRRRRQGVTVKGSVVEWPGLPADVYLYDPPEVVRRHEHGACLQLLRPGDRWFYLHWARPSRTFQDSQTYVEQMLWEALHSDDARRASAHLTDRASACNIHIYENTI